MSNLDDLTPEEIRQIRRRRKRWAAGDLFTVPLPNGRRCLGQVLTRDPKGFMRAPLCGFTLLSAPEGAEPPSRLDREAFVSIQFVTPHLLTYGVWPVIGRAGVPDLTGLAPDRVLRGGSYIGMSVHGSGIMQRFVEACSALRPWDEMHDPAYFDSLLVSPEKKPSGLIYAKRAPLPGQV